MGIKLWLAKRKLNRIVKYRNQRLKFLLYADKIGEWIKQDEKELKRFLKNLSSNEQIEFQAYYHEKYLD